MSQIPYNIVSGLEYQGFNINELLARGYSSMEWGTFLQWREKGFKIKKDEHGAHIRTFVSVTPKRKGDSDIAPKHFVVFNREQVEKVTENYGKNDARTEEEVSSTTAIAG